MHSGNHSLLLRLLATKLSEDFVTGEEKSDSLTFPLPFFDRDFLQFVGTIVFFHRFPLFDLCGAPLRGFRCPEFHGRAIDEEASIL